MKEENKLLIQCVNTNSELVNSSSFDGLFERNAPRVWIDVEVGHSSCITRYTVFKLVVWGLKEHKKLFSLHSLLRNKANILQYIPYINKQSNGHLAHLSNNCYMYLINCHIQTLFFHNYFSNFTPTLLQEIYSAWVI